MNLSLSDVLCNMWKVEYQQQHICAVKGSSVVIPCSFYFPGQRIIKRVIWGHVRYDIFKGPFIFDSKSRNNSSRFQYIGDKHHNCSLTIHHVEHNDIGKYAFRYTTNSKYGKWTGISGSILKVVGKFLFHEQNTVVNLLCTLVCKV